MNASILATKEVGVIAKKPVLRACGYVRVSLEEQAKEGFSIDAQVFAIKKCCVDMGWELVRIYDDPGETGANLDRAGLIELIDDADFKRFDMVVMTDIDRLSRDVADTFTVRKRLAKNGIAMTTTKEPNITSFSSGSTLLDSVRAGLAEEERIKIGQRTKTGMAEMKRRGMHVGRPPLGFVIEMGKLAPNEQGKKIITMLNVNPKLKPVVVKRELNVDYKSAWYMVKACRLFLKR